MATKLSPQEFVAKWRHITLVEKRDNWLNPPDLTGLKVDFRLGSY